ncbi:MAG: hypothetical protein RSB76_01725 [Clostridia bacterium]
MDKKRNGDIRLENKSNIEYNLQLEKVDKDLAKKGYDFIPRSAHLVSIEEQKIKVDEIENITKDK